MPLLRYPGCWRKAQPSPSRALPQRRVSPRHSCLYGEPELRERIDFLRDQNSLKKLRPLMSDRSRTDKNKGVLLAAKDQKIRELEAENERLKKELKAALGRSYEVL